MEKLGQRPVQELSPEAARAQSEANAAALAGESEQVASTAELEVAGVRIRSYLPAGSSAQGADLPLVVFIHGGGWVVGSLDTYESVCRALANRVPCRVVSVDYRLAPEHPFPAAVEGSWAVTRWAFEPSGSVAVAGGSAGGHPAAG